MAQPIVASLQQRCIDTVISDSIASDPQRTAESLRTMPCADEFMRALLHEYARTDKDALAQMLTEPVVTQATEAAALSIKPNLRALDKEKDAMRCIDKFGCWTTLTMTFIGTMGIDDDCPNLFTMMCELIKREGADGRYGRRADGTFWFKMSTLDAQPFKTRLAAYIRNRLTVNGPIDKATAERIMNSYEFVADDRGDADPLWDGFRVNESFDLFNAQRYFEQCAQEAVWTLDSWFQTMFEAGNQTEWEQQATYERVPWVTVCDDIRRTRF